MTIPLRIDRSWGVGWTVKDDGPPPITRANQERNRLELDVLFGFAEGDTE